MVQKRPLPKAHNPLLRPDQSPPYEELVERRRLGQTNLTGKTGPSESKTRSTFDYAHLRAPLPHDLKGSGMFPERVPEYYFLMRRSSDGYVSASGMFKAAFPWAMQSEEDAERKYLKSLLTTSDDETAMNIWIPPMHALELAEEYKIGLWIRALLDPAPIEKGSADPKKHISPPPRFFLPEENLVTENHLAPPPALTPSGGTRRTTRHRSSSPSKAASTKKMASPRKRATKATANHANASSSGAETNAASDNMLQAILEDGADRGKRASAGDKDTVHVEVDSAIDTNGDIETEYTNVRVEMPSHSADLPLPESPAEMIAKAKEMVAEAQKLDGVATKGSRKRKVEDLLEDEDDEEDLLEVQPVKRMKVLEEELKKERVKTRAMIGLSATLAIGAIIPYIF